MATGKSHPMADYPQQTPSKAYYTQADHSASSPPSKRDLASWWRQFKRNTRKEEPKEEPRGIFGVPLNVSIKYANVAISLTNDKGESFIYGYVPIVVAKCGIFLKDKATDVEGIFRLSGSAKRIKDLQEIFDSPDRYGKGLDWTGYTVHDAANVLRRYLNLLPEPIVPLEFYERFREALRRFLAYVDRQADSAGTDNAECCDHAWAVATYQQLIRELPPLNKQLLLYILDLLAVFASKSDQNRMTSANLAAIFQPGLLSHPQHDMAPDEYKLSQDVLIFLIENQDHFLFGMNGTAADEQMVKEVEAGAPPRAAAAPLHSTGVRRSVSSASGGGEGLRKSVNLRRNVSTSSRHSRASNTTGTPGTPTSLTSGGVLRSNTLPSKISPAVSGPRYGKVAEAANAHAPGLPQSDPQTRPDQAPPTVAFEPPKPFPPASEQQPPSTEKPRLTEGLPTTAVAPMPLPVLTPTRERKLSSFFAKSPPPNGEARDLRQPNRLKKKRIPGSASESAQSSSHSLQAAVTEPGVTSATRLNPESHDSTTTADLTPRPAHPVTPGEEVPPEIHYESPRIASSSGQGDTGHSTLRPHGSRTPSMNSRSSFTDHSDLEQGGDDVSRSGGKRRSWRFPRSSKRSDEYIGLGLGSPPLVAVNGAGDFGTCSRSSSRQASKTFAGDLPQSGRDLSHQPLNLETDVRQASLSKEGSQGSESEKLSLFGKIKAKVTQVRDASREKETDRERTKSPSPVDADTTAMHSLSVPPNGCPPPTATGASSEASHEPIGDSAHGHAATTVSSQPNSGMPPAIPEEPATPDREQAALSGSTEGTTAAPTVAKAAVTPDVVPAVEHTPPRGGE